MPIISVPALVGSARQSSNASNFEHRFLGQSPCNIKPWGRLMEEKGSLVSMPCPRGRDSACLTLSQGCNEGGSRLVWQCESGTWHTGMQFNYELDRNWLPLSSFLWVMKFSLNQKVLESWFQTQFQVGMVLNACNGCSSQLSSAHRDVLWTFASISLGKINSAVLGWFKYPTILILKKVWGYNQTFLEARMSYLAPLEVL